jgi:hypothetical protein
MKKIALIAVVAVATTNAFAADLFWSGDTTGGPTFHRAASIDGFSGIGTAVAYQTQDFYVDVTGDYVFETLTAYDGYIHVYEGSFNPNSGVVNLVGGDDDYTGAFSVLGGSGAGIDASQLGTGIGSSFGGLTLTANTQYIAVVTGFGNTDFGTYDAAIGGGQGNVFAGSPVPEPASMIILGSMALAAAAKRCKK